MNWNYEEPVEEKIPDGDYRLRIVKATEVRSKTNKDMLRLTLQISGFTRTMNFHIVFNPDNREQTNRNLQAMFLSFGIPEGNFDLPKYVGKEGAGRIELDDKGQYSNIKYLIHGEKKNSLPPFVEEIPF